MEALRALTLTCCTPSKSQLGRIRLAAPGVARVFRGSRSKERIAKVMSTLGGAVGAAAAVMTTVSATTVSTEEAVHPEISHMSNGAGFPELLTEYMVDMKCEGCVKSVRSKLEQLEGVKSVDVDLPNQLVRVLGTASVKSMSASLDQTGRNARVIGQGSAQDFAVAAAVAEFKGPQIHGVVRIAQVNMVLARVEATFSGLSPGLHGWSINTYGDLTRGAASTGGIFNPQQANQPLGDLGVIVADDAGRAEFSGMKEDLKVADLIGRALVLYGKNDKSTHGIAAAVIARSAGVGENYKKLCTCDGTVIWEG